MGGGDMYGGGCMGGGGGCMGGGCMGGNMGGGKGCCKGKGKSGKSPQYMAALSYVNNWCSGTIKSFNSGNGWGFINCGEIGTDVFVSFKTAPDLRQLLQEYSVLEGLPVKFLLAESQTSYGQFEAKGIAALTSESYSDTAAPGAHANRCEGIFKYFDKASGYGELHCPAIDGDIFVSYETSPGLMQLVEVFGPLEGRQASFVVQPSQSNPATYEASQVELMAGGEAGSYGPCRTNGQPGAKGGPYSH
mmetsp:Transcript_7729/g.17133  ORF Transcript_7729/g.17133 Transcript_7729/m.17133 type:complete len:247 (+) Transcript_7729:1-741(+)